QGATDLPQIVQALSASCCVLGFTQDRQQQRGENCNDCDHNQQLNQGKSLSGLLVHTIHGFHYRLCFSAFKAGDGRSIFPPARLNSLEWLGSSIPTGLRPKPTVARSGYPWVRAQKRNQRQRRCGKVISNELPATAFGVEEIFSCA